MVVAMGVVFLLDNTEPLLLLMMMNPLWVRRLSLSAGVETDAVRCLNYIVFHSCCTGIVMRSRYSPWRWAVVVLLSLPLTTLVVLVLFPLCFDDGELLQCFEVIGKERRRRMVRRLS